MHSLLAKQDQKIEDNDLVISNVSQRIVTMLNPAPPAPPAPPPLQPSAPSRASASSAAALPIVVLQRMTAIEDAVVGVQQAKQEAIILSRHAAVQIQRMATMESRLRHQAAQHHEYHLNFQYSRLKLMELQEMVKNPGVRVPADWNVDTIFTPTVQPDRFHPAFKLWRLRRTMRYMNRRSPDINFEIFDMDEESLGFTNTHIETHL